MDNNFSNQISSVLDHVIGSIQVIKPELALIIAFIVVILSTLFLDKTWKNASFFICLLGIIVSITLCLSQLDNPVNGFFGMLQIDNFSVYARVLLLVALAISAIFIQQHFANKKNSKKIGDIYSILLTAGLGLNLLTCTTNWLLIFIAIETVSISSYILVGFFSENKKQSEAAMKYVLFGSVSAAIMLYGLSLIYGFTGSLDFASQQHIEGLIAAPESLLSIAILFVFAGIGFKLGFVPFHLWTPDVYEGAPTPVTAFLSTVPKIAVIVLLSRLYQAWLSSLFYFSKLTFFIILIAAIVTMLVGNLIALRQTNIKRMMAYSSIGHTGFLLMAIITTETNNPQILMFYLTIYTIMNLATFGLIDIMEQKIGSADLSSYQGLGKQYPLFFTAFTILGISLIGLPPTAGFIGKLLVFSATFDLYQHTKDLPILILLIVGALTSVISLFYYFKIPLFAFLRKSNIDSSFTISFSWRYAIVLLLTGLTVLLGIFPKIVTQLFN